MKLGEYGTLTLDGARKVARQTLARVDLGHDPQQERQERAKNVTFNEYADLYIDTHVNTLRSARGQLRTINVELRPRWGSRRLEDITVRDVLELRQTLADRPYWANRSVEVVSAMFRRAVKWGFLEDGHPNPAADVPRFHEHARDRVATIEELRALIAAIDRLPNPYTRALFRLYVELPLRRQELMNARWENFDRDNRRLVVVSTSDHKRANPQPLSNAAFAIIDGLERVDGNPHIFAGSQPGHPIKNPRSAWCRVWREAGCEELRIHDLRRTLATRMAMAGGSEYQIQQLLGHTTNTAARHYVHLAVDANRGMLQELSNELDSDGASPEGVG